MAAVDRRTFLRDVALASAAAGAAVVPGVSRAVEPPEPPESPEPQAGSEWKKAPCRMCGVGCGLLIAIQNGRAAAVKGDPVTPAGKGLACAKGYYSVQALYGRDRITSAMARRGGRLSPVPLKDALDIVARRLRETIEKHGRNSVGLYGSAQWSIDDAYVASRFFKGGLGASGITTSAGLHSAAAISGLETTFGLDGTLGCYEDVDHADVFVIWDANLAESDPVLFSRMLERRRRDPAVRIVDLSRRTTRTSYASDQSYLVAPQSLIAIANAICGEIVRRGAANRDFIDRHVSFRSGRTDIGHGLGDDSLAGDEGKTESWDAFARFVTAYTPERAQRISGLPSDRIQWLASLYADRSKRVMSLWGANASRHSRGVWTNNALYNIHLLVGKIASPGNAAYCATGQLGDASHINDAGSMSHTLPRGVVANVRDRRRAAAVWGIREAGIDARAGRPPLAMFRAVERGELRFLWIQATNPMVSLPNLDRYRRAAASGKCFIVVSEAFPTPTTDLADVVLPSAMWIEREGVYMNGERRLQHFDRMIAPPGDAKSDGWQMIEVARRVGLGAFFPFAGDGQTRRLWEEYRRFHLDRPHALPAYEDLRRQHGVLFPAPSGVGTKWRYSTAHDPAADKARGSFDFYGTPDHRARIWMRPYDAPAELPGKEFPFWLTTGPVLEHWGGGAMTQRIPTLHRASPHAYVEMNPVDAERLGIERGDIVRVSSPRGSMEIEARIDYRSKLPRGGLFIPSFDESHPVQRLMLDAFCPLSGQPATTTCVARVERTSARAGA